MVRRRLTTLELGCAGLACVALGIACDSNIGAPGGSGNGPAGAPLAGRLVIETGAGVRTVIEQEPNDWSDASQFLGQPADGRVYEIVGVISSPPPDNDVDTYRFTTTEPLTVSWQVTSSDPRAASEFDLDVGVIDFVTFMCALPGIEPAVFAECQVAALSSEGGSFIADGTFEIVVAPSRGQGSYVLIVAFGPPGEAATGSASKSVAPRVPNTTSTRRRTYQPPRGEVVVGQMLAVFRPRMSTQEIEAVLCAHDVRVIERSPCGVYRLGWVVAQTNDKFQARMRTHKAAADLQALPGVRLAEPNRIFRASAVPDDQRYPELRYPELINLPAAWDIATGDRDVIVADIDTGVLYRHPDLGGRLLGGYDFVSDPAKALDGDGRDDDPSDPGDAPNAAHGSSFHGTHTAGTLAAMTNNQIGVAGVTWSCWLMPIRALGLGSEGDAFDIAEAIRYAAGLENVSGTLPPRRADIINLSFDSGAGAQPSTVMEMAVREAADAGVIMMSAAGNQASDKLAYPAGFEEVISVGAVDWELELASYSNYGPTIDLVAPGGSDAPDAGGEPDGLLSTLGSDITEPITFEYGYRFGTSMACPQVAGVAALMVSVNPELSADQVRRILVETARELGDPGRDDLYGYGLLDAAAAVDRARNMAGETTRPPALSLDTQVLDFGVDLTGLTIEVTNAGGGVLAIEDVSVRERVGEGWLSAESSGGSASSTVSRIRVTVDRYGLPPGVYRGVIEVAVAGAAMTTVDVHAQVAGSTGPSDGIHVLAIDPASGQVIGQAEAKAEADFAFVLDGTGNTPVLLFAGTDRDGDGEICEADDACGAWPSLLEPLELDASASSRLDPVEISIFEPASVGDWPVEHAALCVSE